MQASGREAAQRSSLRVGSEAQQGHGGGVGRPVQRAVEQPPAAAAVHPQAAAAVHPEAQAGIPRMPAAIPEDRPVLAEDHPAVPAMANQVQTQLAVCTNLSIQIVLAV